MNSFKEYLIKNTMGTLFVEMAQYGEQPRTPVLIDEDDIGFLRQFKKEEQTSAIKQRYDYLYDALVKLHARRNKAGMKLLEEYLIKAITNEIASIDNKAKSTNGLDSLKRINNSDLQLSEEEIESIKNHLRQLKADSDKPLSQIVSEKDIEEEAQRISYLHFKKTIDDLTPEDTGTNENGELIFSFKIGNKKPYKFYAKPFLNRLYHKLERNKGEPHKPESSLRGVGKYSFDLADPIKASSGEFDFTTDDKVALIENGSKVLVKNGYDKGGVPGTVYKYQGETQKLNLANQNYTDAKFWIATKEDQEGKIKLTRGMKFPSKETIEQRLLDYHNLNSHGMFTPGGDLVNAKNVNWVKSNYRDKLTLKHALEPYLRQAKKIFRDRYADKTAQLVPGREYTVSMLRKDTILLARKLLADDIAKTPEKFTGPKYPELDANGNPKINQNGEIVRKFGYLKATKSGIPLTAKEKKAAEDAKTFPILVANDLFGTNSIETYDFELPYLYEPYDINPEKFQTCPYCKNKLDEGKRRELIQKTKAKCPSCGKEIILPLKMQKSNFYRALNANDYKTEIVDGVEQFVRDEQGRKVLKDEIASRLIGHSKKHVKLDDNEFRYGMHKNPHQKAMAFDFNHNMRARAYVNELSPENKALKDKLFGEMEKVNVEIVQQTDQNPGRVIMKPDERGAFYKDFVLGIIRCAKGNCGGTGAPTHWFYDEDYFLEVHGFIVQEMLLSLRDEKWSTPTSRKRTAKTIASSFMQYAGASGKEYVDTRQKRSLKIQKLKSTEDEEGDSIDITDSDVENKIRTDKPIKRTKGGRIHEFGKEGFYNDLKKLREKLQKEVDEASKEAKLRAGVSEKTAAEMRSRMNSISKIKAIKDDVESEIVQMLMDLMIFRDIQDARNQVRDWKNDLGDKANDPAALLAQFNSDPRVSEKIGQAENLAKNGQEKSSRPSAKQPVSTQPMTQPQQPQEDDDAGSSAYDAYNTFMKQLDTARDNRVDPEKINAYFLPTSGNTISTFAKTFANLNDEEKLTLQNLISQYFNAQKPAAERKTGLAGRTGLAARRLQPPATPSPATPSPAKPPEGQAEAKYLALANDLDFLNEATKNNLHQLKESISKLSPLLYFKEKYIALYNIDKSLKNKRG